MSECVSLPALPKNLADYLCFLVQQDPDGEGLIETNYIVRDEAWDERAIEAIETLLVCGYLVEHHPYLDITNEGREVARLLMEQKI